MKNSVDNSTLKNLFTLFGNLISLLFKYDKVSENRESYLFKPIINKEKTSNNSSNSNQLDLTSRFLY